MVLFASTFAVVAPATIRTSISFDQRQTVRQSRFVLGCGVFKQGGSQPRADPLVDVPCRLQFASRVIRVEHGLEAAAAPIAERVARSE